MTGDQTLDDKNFTPSVLDLTADIVAAFVSNNKIDADAVSALIASTYQALNVAGSNQPLEEFAEDLKKTRAEIRKSITGSHLISFIDGKPYRSLKRHLNTNGLSLAAYKERYGLPADYPSTAPEYSAARSALAKAAGLGQGGRAAKAKAARAPRARKAADA